MKLVDCTKTGQIIALASLASLIAQAAPALAQETQIVTLAQSPAYVATSDAAQHFSETINLNKGQDKLNLTLTYYNGTATAPGFKWLRISSSSMSYITEQQFMGRKELSVDVTGELSWGGNQILVSAAGQPGSTFNWVLTTPKPQISSIKPDTLAPGGTLTIFGTNLCPSISADSVIIGGSPAHCISATTDSIVVQVPEDLKGGASTVALTTAGFDCGTVACTVNAVPSLSRLSNSWAPAGTHLTIYGEGFSSNPSSVRVSIGPVQVPIDAVSNNSITVTVPASFETAWAGYYMPVKVIVNGVKARNQLTVSCAETANF